MELTTESVDRMETLLGRYRSGEGNVIWVLQQMQEIFGFVPETAVDWFSERAGVSPNAMYGVATFYAQFHFKPRGKHIVTACCGTACHVKGSDRIISRLQDEFKLSKGENTTEDGMFTVEKVACVGACSIAPVVIVDKHVYGKMSPGKTMQHLEKLAGVSDEQG